MSAIESVPGLWNNYSFFVPSLSGRIQLPVQASQSLYAQFEFVQGVPSEHGGLSLDRLQIIDALLSQINDHRETTKAPLTRSDVDLQHPDEAIVKLSQQVRDLQKQATPFHVWSGVEGQVVNVRV